MNKELFARWFRECENLVSTMPHILFKTKRKDIPLPFGIHDIYREFVISQITKNQRQDIYTELESFSKEYPEVLRKIFTKSGDLTRIKKVYVDALNKMKEIYAFQEIINTCESISNLITQEQDNDFRFYYDILREIGKAWYSLGYFKKSIEYYQLALNIAIEKKLADSDPFGWIGVAYFNLGQYEEAIGSLQQAINIAKCYKENENLVGFWLGTYANAVRDSGLIMESISMYDEPLAIAKKTGDRENESRWLGNKGNAERDLGESENARELYKQAFEIAREINAKFLQGRWLNNIGNTIDEPIERIEYYEKSLHISRECGDHHNENIVLGNLGHNYMNLKQFGKAISYYKNALEITIGGKDMMRAKGHIDGLLNIYKNIRKLKELIGYLKKKLDKAKEHVDQEEEIFWLYHLGYAFQDLAHCNKAKDYYHQALNIARHLRDSKYEKNLIYMLDEVSLLEISNLCDKKYLEEAFKKSNDLIINILNRGFSEFIKSFSDSYKIKYPLDEINKEIQDYRNGINNNPSDDSLHMKLADCYARKGDLADAIFEYKKTIDLKPSNIITVLSMMEVTVWRRQYSEAINIYHEWSKKITLPYYKVIASWIVCTALVLDGKSCGNYMDPLLDTEINLSKTHYSYQDILPYFVKLIEEGFQIERLINVWELHNLFTTHFRGITRQLRVEFINRLFTISHKV